MIRVYTITIALLGCVQSQSIYCPVLTCDIDSQLPSNQCYQHDGQQPVQQIYAYPCEYYGTSTFPSGTPLCEFDINSNMYAWYNESTQNYSMQTFMANGVQPLVSDSAIYDRKSQAKCYDSKASLVNRNNGRSCSTGAHCFSKICYNGTCTGLALNQYCSSHADCNSGNYCLNSTVWPYQSTCTALMNNYAICNDDYECLPSSYCWYANSNQVVSKLKMCLPLYSQDIGTSFGWYSHNNLTSLTLADYEINGRYCKSGLAFPISSNQGNCTSADRIQWQGLSLTWPYSCDPTNQTPKCQIWYNASNPNDALILPQKSLLVQCNCALNGNNGYCSSVIGTTQYAAAVAQLRTILQASSCHTLDRFDLRAQRDICGINNSTQLDSAVSGMFNVKYHAWVQDSSVNFCINTLFSDSLFNQQKTIAAIIQSGTQSVSSPLLMSSFLLIASILLNF